MTRVVSGVVLAGAFFAIVWYGNHTVLLTVTLAVGALAFHEYAQLTGKIGAAMPRGPALLATLATIAVVPFPFVAVEAVLGMGVVGVAVAALVGLARLAPGPTIEADPAIEAVVGPGFSRAVLGVLAGGFAPVYIGLPLGALVAIHMLAGRNAVLLLLATIVISDTAQYYTGRLLGRRRLAPRVSPKKTVEGALGGLVAAPIVLYFAGPYLVPVPARWWMAALGLVLVASGIAGDLFESLIKRAAGTKDSGALIPGHGGVLDRIDALLFATPVFYAYLRWAS
jgi:phosphatidate cytidylyltransferase